MTLVQTFSPLLENKVIQCPHIFLSFELNSCPRTLSMKLISYCGNLLQLARMNLFYHIFSSQTISCSLLEQTITPSTLWLNVWLFSLTCQDKENSIKSKVIFSKFVSSNAKLLIKQTFQYFPGYSLWRVPWVPHSK